jgi:tRNA pseudouridine(38-40) synthase
VGASVRRIKILVSYDGTDYHGWQVQPGLPTIQGALEDVISGIEGRAVQVAGSGRTDAGVHALGQVAAFSIENPIPVDNLRRAVNRLLPRDIRVLSVEEAAPDFHPRFQAERKTYEYRIFRGEICSPFERRYVCHHPYPLAVEEMIGLAPLLEGEQDFTAFADHLLFAARAGGRSADLSRHRERFSEAHGSQYRGSVIGSREGKCGSRGIAGAPGTRLHDSAGADRARAGAVSDVGGLLTLATHIGRCSICTLG